MELSVRHRPGGYRLFSFVVGAALASLLALATTAAGQPAEVDVYVAEGTLALEDKQYEAAIEHFRRALERNPEHVEALYLTGVAYLALGKPTEAVQILERARRNAPSDMAITQQLGLAYLRLNQPERAQPLLESVFAREPELDSLGYYVGLLRYQKKQYQSALKAFKAGRTSDPNIAQLTRLYAGLSLAALGLSSQGAEEIERAVRMQPASPLTGPAELLRASLARRDEARRLRAAARFGLYVDDNARAAPDPAPSAVVNDLRHAQRRTVGELFTLGVDYDWLRRDAWTASVGYSFLTTYNNSIPNLNLIDHVGVLGVSHRDVVAGMPLDTGLQYALEYVMLGGSELLLKNTVAATGTLLESGTHLTNVIARVDIKDYAQPGPLPPNQGQDATNWMIGGLHLVRFDRDRHFVKAGYQFDIEDSKGRDFSYRGHRVLAGGQYTLPWRDIRLGYDLSYHYRDYTNRNSLFPENHPGTRERSDHELTQLARVAVPLVATPEWGRFELLADYVRTDADSNLAVYRYTRNVFTLSLSWRY